MTTNDSIPANLRYTKDHEWARVESDGTITVGITAYAVDSLGDITLVTLPRVGDALTAGSQFGDVDSVKAVSQLFAPLDGEVVAVNERLNDAPESVNAEPYGAGWMLRVRPSNPDTAVADLLDAQAYARHIAENG